MQSVAVLVREHVATVFPLLLAAGGIMKRAGSGARSSTSSASSSLALALPGTHSARFGRSVAAERVPAAKRSGNELVDQQRDSERMMLQDLIDGCIDDASHIMPLYTTLQKRRGSLWQHRVLWVEGLVNLGRPRL